MVAGYFCGRIAYGAPRLRFNSRNHHSAAPPPAQHFCALAGRTERDGWWRKYRLETHGPPSDNESQKGNTDHLSWAPHRSSVVHVHSNRQGSSYPSLGLSTGLSAAATVLGISGTWSKYYCRSSQN